MRDSVLLRLPATLAYRQIACRTVSSVCMLYQGSAQTESVAAARLSANELMSAVGEAFNNIVLHAYSDSGEGDVELELSRLEHEVVVELRDMGVSFDFDSFPVPDLDLPREGGMGVHIIRSFVDRIEYRAGPPNVLVLAKRLVGVKPTLRTPRGRTGGGRVASG